MKFFIVLLVVLVFISGCANFQDSKDLEKPSADNQENRTVSSSGFQCENDNSVKSRGYILLMGLGDHGKEGWIAEKKLMEQDPKSKFVLIYDQDENKNLQEISDKFLLDLNNVLKKNPVEELVLFGASAGGVTASYSINKLDFSGPVALHTLSSPLKGYDFRGIGEAFLGERAVYEKEIALGLYPFITPGKNVKVYHHKTVTDTVLKDYYCGNFASLCDPIKIQNNNIAGSKEYYYPQYDHNPLMGPVIRTVLKCYNPGIVGTIEKENIAKGKGEALGTMCLGEENCRTFCHTNKGRCGEYCKKNPENILCQNSFVYDCNNNPDNPVCKKELEQEKKTLEDTYNALKTEIDNAVSSGSLLAQEHYKRVIADLDSLQSKGYQKEKIGQLKQKALSILSGYSLPQDKFPAGNQTISGNQTTIPKASPGFSPAISPSPSPALRIADPHVWVKDSIVQPLPNGASTARLVLPVPIDKITIKKIGAFGAHLGGHPEGLDHEWIEIKNDIPIGSWGDGEVTKVYENRPGESRVVINFGDGLVGEYMEMKTPLVKVGDKVTAGQAIGYGIPAYNNPGYQSGEFVLGDNNRRDGIKSWVVQYGSAVSPFDYLKDDAKQQLVSEFTKQVIEPYISKGQSIETFGPWEPYLTNPLLIHKQNKGTIAGEWYLKSRQWAKDDSPDMLILLKANTKYYDKNRLVANDDEEERFVGTWEVDYSNKTFVFNTNVYGLFYGIFELDESGPRATLKIEYKTGSYPSGFSDKALVYIERDAVQRRDDARSLGVWSG